MVKGNDIVPGLQVQLKKELPEGANPGIDFTGKLGLHERLVVLTRPYNAGSNHLVKVMRLRTGQEFQCVYSVITNFCKPVPKDTVPATPAAKGSDPPKTRE
jgi:hypothetical protein